VFSDVGFYFTFRHLIKTIRSIFSGLFSGFLWSHVLTFCARRSGASWKNRSSRFLTRAVIFPTDQRGAHDYDIPP